MTEEELKLLQELQLKKKEEDQRIEEDKKLKNKYNEQGRQKKKASLASDELLSQNVPPEPKVLKKRGRKPKPATTQEEIDQSNLNAVVENGFIVKELESLKPSVQSLKVMLSEKKAKATFDQLINLVPEISPGENDKEKEVTGVVYDNETGCPIGVTRFKKKEEVTIDPLVDLLKGLSKQEIIENCMYDLNFLSRFLLPDLHKYDYPPLLINMWKMVIIGVMDLEEFIGIARYALGIPRGFIKTTVFVKILSIYLMLFTSKNFGLIIGSTEPNAVNIIKDIIDLMRSDQFVAIFGDISKTMITERKELVRFILNGKDCIFVAKGTLGSSRGLSIGFKRPSFIIADDMQTEENAASDAESERTITWWSSTVLPSVAPEGSIVVFVGNTFAYDGALLNYLIKDKAWVSLTLGAILSDGTSLWEELMPIKMLLESFRSALVVNRDTQWLAQMMNATDISHNSSLDVEAIEEGYARTFLVEGEEIEYPTSYSWIMIDPASQRKKADDISIVRNVVDEMGYMRTTHSLKQQMNPEENILAAVGLAIETDTPIICVEDVAYQITLIFWIEKYCKQLNIDWIRVMKYNPGKQHKNVRITVDFRVLAQQGHFINRDVWERHYRPQALMFNKMKTDNTDDVLDNVASSYNFNLRFSKQIKEIYDTHNTRRLLKLQEEAKKMKYLKNEVRSPV